MRSRSQAVTAAAILMALFSLMNLPGPWWYAILGVMEQTPIFVVYSGIVLAIVGIIAALGLWMLKTWGFWLTLVVSVINILFNVSGLAMALGTPLKVAIAVQTIGFVLVIVLVVLPTSRRELTASSLFRPGPFGRPQLDEHLGSLGHLFLYSVG